MKTIRLISLAVIAAGVFASGVFGQVSSFSDPAVDYGFDVPDAKWKMTTKPSATSPNVEYVFVDRNDGHLQVRKLTVANDAILSDVIRNEEVKLQLMPGYVTGREENFRGRLAGTAFNFEYVRSGRPMSGRFYFLRANPTTIYVLRFTGFTDKLRTIRNQTDAIARTFHVKS
jgi:hypothetical protein